MGILEGYPGATTTWRSAVSAHANTANSLKMLGKTAFLLTLANTDFSFKVLAVLAVLAQAQTLKTAKARGNGLRYEKHCSNGALKC